MSYSIVALSSIVQRCCSLTVWWDHPRLVPLQQKVYNLCMTYRVTYKPVLSSTLSKWFQLKIITLSSQIPHMRMSINMYPAVPPSAVASWTGCHRPSHCSPRMMSALQPPPHSHQPLQSAEGCVPHSPASSAGIQWEQLPTKYTNTEIVLFVCARRNNEITSVDSPGYSVLYV